VRVVSGRARGAQLRWATCRGFQIGDYLFLSDAASEDDLSEYAVLRARMNAAGQHQQVDSVAFGQMSPQAIVGYLHELRGQRPRDQRVLDTFAIQEFEPCCCPYVIVRPPTSVQRDTQPFGEAT
jgi:hypothetical protein